MPADRESFLPHSNLMSASEILRVAKEFVRLGVTKIRLTGGEPLVRRDFPEILESLSTLPVELTLTTNGLLVHKYIDEFRRAGVKSVNVSLDSLIPEKVKAITRRNSFERVFENIQLLVENNVYVKINVVLLKGVNTNEIESFVELTRHMPVHVRFIEFMPFAGNTWTSNGLVTHEEVLRVVGQSYSFIKIQDEQNDTAKKYVVYGHKGTFAIITTMSQPFCDNCNRIRITADGKLKNCLFSVGEFDLLTPLRSGSEIKDVIQQAISAKKKERGGQFAFPLDVIDSSMIANRSMVDIGG